MPGVLVYTNLRYTQELETEGLWVWGQPVLYSETLWKEGEVEKKVE